MKNSATHGIDHVEIAVRDLGKHSQDLEQMGFELMGERNTSDETGRLFGQGMARVLLTRPTAQAQTHASRFQAQHNEGVMTIAIEVEDAAASFHAAVARGAKSASAPQSFATAHGTLARAEIWTPCDLRYRFVSRVTKPDCKVLFDKDLMVDGLGRRPSPLNIQLVDHYTNNIRMGESKMWLDFYQNILGFRVFETHDIDNGVTGFLSTAICSPNGLIKIPVIEPLNELSQNHVFNERFNGPGVQHVAFLTNKIVDTLNQLRAKNLNFLKVPKPYYQELKTRIPGLRENLADLERLSILADGNRDKYLLQIFAEESMGPFFYEYIERHGHSGFGEGNVRALFDAVQRDQEERAQKKAA